MKHAVVTTTGAVTFADEPLDLRSLLGIEGSDRVRLHPESGMAGWVNGCGLALPERYARNVVGSCLLIALGAAPQPYAGPVVLTGWTWVDGAFWERSDLPHADTALAALVSDVTAALADEPVPGQSAEWPPAIRAFAETVLTGPVPPPRITRIASL